jgi:2',3'-cyclic-nucleotide 2'-phosphodiesterase (5'-nucleotidase family)
MGVIRVKRWLTVPMALLVLAAAAVPAWADAVVTSTATLSSEGASKGETTLGDLVADALRQGARADVGLIHAEMLREVAFPPGPVSEASLRHAIVVPLDETVVLRLSGRQLKQALERSVRNYPAKNQGFLQVSGLSATFDPSKPEGSRIVDLKVGGAPVADGRVYTVAMPALLADGAQGYHRVWEGAERVKDRKPGAVADLVASFAKARGQLSYKVEGRLKEAPK